ncbi:MAG: phosphatidate cytidylyltransferase [Sediminibacterium sp.]|jgi:phosphatidate cytidylyltransferase|nr:phosphatidate cytidylyltransferase [Sediminibacterium sp.]
MALNFSVLKVRTISAVIFAVIMIGGILWNQWSFFALFTIIQLGCLFEYQKLMRIIFPEYGAINKVHQWGVLVLGVFTTVALASLPYAYKGLPLTNYATYGIIGVAVIILLADLVSKKINFKSLLVSAVGIIYISMGLSLIFQLRALMSNTFVGDIGYTIPLILIVTIWVNDTAAYLVGSLIGRRPLSSISPNKTWEGTIAGVVISVLLVTKIMGQYIPLSEKSIFLISIVASIAGTFGDLVESKLKRVAGVKDSGSMMPGHGGFLDRFDSILLATPFVWLLIQLVY